MKITNFLPSSLNTVSPSFYFTSWKGRQILVGIVGLVCIGLIIKKIFFSKETPLNFKPDITENSKPDITENSKPDIIETPTTPPLNNQPKTERSDLAKEYYRLPSEQEVITFRITHKKSDIYTFDEVDFIEVNTVRTTINQLEKTLISQGWDQQSALNILKLIQQIPVPAGLGLYNATLTKPCSKCVISKDETGKIEIVFNNFWYKNIIGSGSGYGNMSQQITQLTASHKESNKWELVIEKTKWIEKKVHPVNLLSIPQTMEPFIIDLQSEVAESPIKVGLVSCAPFKIERCSDETQATNVDPFLTDLKKADKIFGWEKLGTAFQDFVLKAIPDEDFSHEKNLLPSCELKSSGINRTYFMLIKFMAKEKSFQLGFQIDLKTYQPSFGGRSEIDYLTINSGFYVEWQKIEEGQDLPQLTICK